ncbi:hypothetical protein Tco_0862259 [Tanacetum coccineum]
MRYHSTTILATKFNFKSLATWGKDDGITTLVKSILDGSGSVSFGQGGGDFLKERTKGNNNNIRQCLRKVADGHFTTAVKVLSSSGVAPYCDDIIKALEAKHPYKPPPSMPSKTFSEPPLGSALLKVITSVVNLWLAGRNEIRLIAVGAIWRRLVFKVAMKGVGKEMSNYLSDFQFGVEVSGGAQAILHSVNGLLSEYHNDGSLAMLIIRDSYKLLRTVIGDSEEVARVLDIIKVSGLAVSRDAYFISGMAMRRAVNAVDLMSLLSQLHDPQSELLLLRSCMVVLSLETYSDGLLLYPSVSVVWVCTRQKWILPMLLWPRGPNLGCYKTTSYVTVAMCAIFSEMVKDMEAHFDMTVRQKAVFKCLRAPHAQDFLLYIPIDGLGQHMSPVEYHTIIKHHLIILLLPVDAICPISRKACLDSFGEHAVHCKEITCFKYRHDMVMDILFNICRCVGISIKKEAPVNFLTDPSDRISTLRPAEVLVFGWVGGKHTCVDLTGVPPHVGLSGKGFTVG